MFQSPLNKYKLNQAHINCRAACYGQNHLSPPQMKGGDRHDTNQFGDAEAEGSETDILQTIYHKHSENCGGKRLAEILNVFWCGSVVAENQKWQKAGSHCTYGTNSYGYNLFHNRHSKPPAFSIGLLKAVSKTRMHKRVGKRK